MWPFFKSALETIPSWARVIVVFIVVPAFVCITAWFIYTVTLSIGAAMQNGREVEIKSIGLHIASNCQTVRDAVAPLTTALGKEGSEWRNTLAMERMTQSGLRDQANRESVGTTNRQALEDDIRLSRIRVDKVLEISAKIDGVRENVEALINSRC